MNPARELYEDLFYKAYPGDISFDLDAGPEFDAAIREIQAQAWDRGQHAAFGFSVENPHFTPSDMVGTKYDNPYRKEQQ